MTPLIDEFKKGSLRALSRLISLAEMKDPQSLTALAQLYTESIKTQIFGITGPPGAGKSSLVGALISKIREQNKSVAVIAVDPVSPFTGGSLLGDRIRLSDHFNDDNVFIRSLSTRGRLGGLSLATREAVHLAAAFGFDYVIVETVGVGQSEIDVRHIAQVTAVVLVPESGDAVQTIKAGLLEIADLLVVNKADRQGATKLQTELKSMVEGSKRPQVPVLLTQSNKPETIEPLFKALTEFKTQFPKIHREREAMSQKMAVRELLQAEIQRRAQTVLNSLETSNENPYSFAAEFLKKNPAEKLFSTWQN